MEMKAVPLRFEQEKVLHSMLPIFPKNNIEDRINSFLRQHGCNIPITDGYGSTEVSAIALSPYM